MSKEVLKVTDEGLSPEAPWLGESSFDQLVDVFGKRLQENSEFAGVIEKIVYEEDGGVIVKGTRNREVGRPERMLGEWAMLAAEKAYLEHLSEGNNGLNESQGAHYLQLDAKAARIGDYLRLSHKGEREVMVADRVVGVEMNPWKDVVDELQEKLATIAQSKSAKAAMASVVGAAVVATSGCGDAFLPFQQDIGTDDILPPPAETTPLPYPGMSVAEVSETTPTEQLPQATPTTETISTQEVFPGDSDSSFLAVPGVPEGFGGTGEISELVNNQQIQDNLNRQGYAPVANGGGVLSRTQSQDGSEVCNSNLPDKIYNPDVPSEEDTRIAGESGIVSYGDSETGEIRVKAIGVVSTDGLPDEWDCLNAVVVDKENPAGWGALRTLVIDGEGNIKAERPAAYAGTDNLEVRWENSGPSLYVNGNAVNFTFREGVQPTKVEPTPTEEVETPESVAEELGIVLDEDRKYILGEATTDEGTYTYLYDRYNATKLARFESGEWVRTTLEEKYGHLAPKGKTYYRRAVVGTDAYHPGSENYKQVKVDYIATGDWVEYGIDYPDRGEITDIGHVVVMRDVSGKLVRRVMSFVSPELEGDKRLNLYFNRSWDDTNREMIFGNFEELKKYFKPGTTVFIQTAYEWPRGGLPTENCDFPEWCTNEYLKSYYLFREHESDIKTFAYNLINGIPVENDGSEEDLILVAGMPLNVVAEAEE